MFSAIAWAQTAAAKPSMIEQLMPFVFILVVFFFLIIRPQQKRQKQQQAMLAGLKKGDSVLTTGGIIGTIEGLTESVVILQISDGVKIRILRSQISALANEELMKK